MSVREVPVGAAGIYAPGGRAAYPSSVLMCAIPAQVAGVERVALASPPGPDGRLHPLVLAAAALCEVEEIYAMGGAQAIFALAHGTETIAPVDVIVGPGQRLGAGGQARRLRHGRDRLPGRALGADADRRPRHRPASGPPSTSARRPSTAPRARWSPLPSRSTCSTRSPRRPKRAAAERPSVADAPLALVAVPDIEAAIALANAYAPEHLELLEEDAALLAERVRTAGCVFVGRYGATAFGDYVAGSNHVLPTGGAGRFSGPLGPGAFRRRISKVEIDGAAARELAPHADALARPRASPSTASRR